MTDQRSSMIVHAEPTKEFFIEMLVKDISSMDAIIDLVDNCVDGALGLRGDGDFKGLSVRITLDKDRLWISDNCGGIDVDLAREYAFRFGRPEAMELIPGSIGRFGVGMKRAFFKLGRRFKIESRTATHRWVVEEDVDEWKKKDQWQFEFKKIEDSSDVPEEQRGTTITVTSLHEPVAKQFELDNFRTRLLQRLELRHKTNLDKGLAISLNEIPLHPRLLQVLHSRQLKTAYREMVFEDKGRPPVTVKIYAGISKSKPPDAGWYLFCNGRVVLDADQTITTGWGETEGEAIPKYHNQFARFRGYALFDSNDAGWLPWNTTKTDVDPDSPLFQAVRLEMIALMRPVITFLNQLDAEKGSKEPGDRPLEEAVAAAGLKRFSEVDTAEVFSSPKPVRKPRLPQTGTITYARPREEIERVKRILGVRSHREVGEKTFEYFYRKECED